MTPTQAQDLLRMLRDKDLTLQDLHERVRAAGSPWSVEQVELFILCGPGVRRDQGRGTFRVAQLDSGDALQEAVVEAVRSFAGKPVSAAQVRSRLPDHFVTTDEQILSVARRTAGLEVFGPKLIRISQ